MRASTAWKLPQPGTDSTELYAKILQKFGADRRCSTLSAFRSASVARSTHLGRVLCVGRLPPWAAAALHLRC
eukprot:363127-Chlamydomonas_euryale.AAC.3